MERNFIKVDKWGDCLWGIDETGKLFINEGAAGDVSETGVPWESFTALITEAAAIGRVTFPEGASLAGLFRGCKSMETADLSGFDTTGVRDMSSMFEGCTHLKELDISSFDTTSCASMERMFAKCARLTDILMGEGFSLTGDGTTSCDRLAVKTAGNYRRARVIAAEGAVVRYHENAGRDVVSEMKTVPAYRYLIEDLMYNAPGAQYKFLGWNTAADGSGAMYAPGQELAAVDDDMDLYAIWASAPEIGEVHPIKEFSFGEPIPFELPEIVSAGDPMVTGFLEVSPTGEDGSWQAIDHNTILPVSCNGWLVRLCAANSVGKSYSEPVRLRIRKAIIDMSSVRWAEDEDMTYDGSEKHVWVEGIPQGLSSLYKGNVATLAGTYTASIDLGYDEQNFSEPLMVREHEWTIRKAVYDMSSVRWDHEEDFVYDGTEKAVSLTGLPEGVTATLKGNTATAAGVYTAVAELSYDEANYEKPAEVTPCVWEIRKAAIDPASLEWSSDSDFVYDGEAKSVSIINLPEDAEVMYEGESETAAGKYLARAAVGGSYSLTGPAEYEWEIRKASYDMSQAAWDYAGPFTYDRETHSIGLTGVPSELGIRYRGNTGAAAGDYMAGASFDNPDTHNYFTPDDMEIKWTIRKRTADMSAVRWDYEGPYTYDGTTRQIALTGLPEGVYADYTGAGASNAGVYTARAILKYDEDNIWCEQPADCQWKIDKKRIDVSGVRWDYEGPFTYDGQEHGIYLTGLPEGVNVEYSDNVMTLAGKYAASATLTPCDSLNYEAPEVSGCTWTISRAPIDPGVLEWTDSSSFVYDGSEKTVEITGGAGEGLNIEYLYNKQKNAGRYFAKAVFMAVDDKNFRAPDPVGHAWAISKADPDMSCVTWDYAAPFTYDGSVRSVRLINLPEGLTATYSGADAADAGDYTAIARFSVTDTHNYNTNIPDMTLEWRIDKARFDFSGVKWQETREFSYDGEDKEIRLTGLPEGLEAVYAGNKGSGASEYAAVADFVYDTRNYEKPEVMSTRWQIDRSPVDISLVRWDYEEPFVYDGTEKSVIAAGIPEGAYAEYGSARAVQAGTYIATASIIPDDRDNRTPSKLENLTWRIEKGDYDMSHARWDYDKAFTYDGTEHKVVLRGLPEGVFPVYRNNTATASGSYRASVTFRIADERNFRVPEFADCDWEIRKADIDMSGVVWNYSGEYKYTGRMYEVLLRGLPDNVRAVYSGNVAADTGSYVASADLLPYDPDNYNKPYVRECGWQIVRADHEMGAVKWDHQGSKVYNGRPQSVYLEQLPGGVTAEYTDNEATDVGHYTAKAVLSVADPKNYNVPSVADCDWEIVPADYDLSEATWTYDSEDFVYDGERRSIVLKDLPAGLTAEYTGNSGVQAGEYTATASFATTDSNFKAPEPQTFRWKIGKAEADMSHVNWDYTSEFTYDGTLKKVEVTGLPEGVGVEYENNAATDAGEYTATARFITGSSNYREPAPMTCRWVINKADPDIRRVSWDYAGAFTYDGTVRAARLTGLPEYMDVSYTGSEAVEAGRYTAHAELMPKDPDNYNTPSIADCDWEIVRADYDMSDARWTGDIESVYDGSYKTVTLTGLPEGVTPVYKGNTAVDAGSYLAGAEFLYDEANYNKPAALSQEWSIAKSSYDMTRAAWTYDGSFTYDGTAKSISLTGLPEGVTAAYTGNVAVDSGAYEAEATLYYDERNYEKPVFGGCRWEIDMADAPIDASGIRWNYTGPFVYDGTPKTVAFAEKTLEQGFFDRLRGRKAEVVIEGVPEGFEIRYENNTATDAGVYYAGAVLVNPADTNYREFRVPECKWEILKAETDVSGARWDYDKAFTYDGEEKSVRLTGLPDTVRVTYTSNTATDAGEYEALAELTAADPLNYETPKQVRGCWWQIEKARYDMSGAAWEKPEDLVYSGEEKSVAVTGLPDGVRVESYTGNKAIEAGSYTAQVRLSYSNRENYEEPEMPELKWQISKKQIDTSGAEWNYGEGTLFVYDGKPKEVRLTGVPKEIEVVYIDNSKINAGTYTAKARLIYDARNCDAADIPDLRWTIEKATYDTDHVHWSYDKPFTYDAYEKSIVLRNVPKSIDVRYRDNKASAIGTYTAKAYLTYDTENYNAPEIETTIDWEIVPKNRG